METLTGWFYSNLVQRYNVVFLTKLQFFVKINWEITSQWGHYCFGGLDLPKAPLQESVARATAKDLHSNFYLIANFYIFLGKVTKFGWIIFLPLWVMGKRPQGWCWTPPGQDRVKALFSHFCWMVAMDTTTVMKILISIFGDYFQAAQGCKVWLWPDKGIKCYHELNFSFFFVSDHLNCFSHNQQPESRAQNLSNESQFELNI